jgi:hypothetical protein
MRDITQDRLASLKTSATRQINHEKLSAANVITLCNFNGVGSPVEPARIPGKSVKFAVSDSVAYYGALGLSAPLDRSDLSLNRLNSEY